MRAREVQVRPADAEAWDAFARTCGASVRGSYGYSIGWAVKNLLSHRLRFVELFDHSERKIGQCAIGQSRRGRAFVFLDQLQLLSPTFDWVAAMKAVLATLGAGDYRYGWVLNLELAREGDLAEIAGVTVTETNPIIVHAVDFANWPSWSAYFSSIGENNRRNAKAAAKRFPDLSLRVRQGLDTLRDLPKLVRLRANLVERKALGARPAGAAALGYAANIVIGRKYMVTATVSGGGADLSCFYGSDFGANTYYLEGASAPQNGGAAWHLLIEMLRRSYERAPAGKFVMGYIDYSTHDDEKSAGLLRSRQSCRITEFPTSIVSFRYAPA